jgi:hypothetical protein
MALPPGYSEGKPVDGINATTDPELARAAGELNAWLDYLFHPERHDGPRIYRGHGVDRSGHQIEDSEMPRRMENLDEDSQYTTVSILDGYLADPGVFFRPAQAVSGISDSVIDATYKKLAVGCLTWTSKNRKASKSSGDPGQPVTNVHYPEMHPARINWMEMRNGWFGRTRLAAHEYENDFIPFQVYTENCFYVVAEHVVRYRVIFKKASEDITKSMFALTDTFAKHDWYGGGDGIKFDLWSIVVTSVVAAATTVVSGGAALPAIVLIEAVGETLKTAERDPKEKAQLLIEDHYHLRDSAKQYVDLVTKIERDTVDAVKQLYESLRVEVDKLRDQRKYQVTPNSTGESMWVPRLRDYL